MIGNGIPKNLFVIIERQIMQLVKQNGKCLWMAHHIKTPLCGQVTHCTVYNVTKIKAKKINFDKYDINY